MKKIYKAPITVLDTKDTWQDSIYPSRKLKPNYLNQPVKAIKT